MPKRIFIERRARKIPVVTSRYQTIREDGRDVIILDESSSEKRESKRPKTKPAIGQETIVLSDSSYEEHDNDSLKAEAEESDTHNPPASIKNEAPPKTILQVSPPIYNQK
jgi:hypothetical protein